MSRSELTLLLEAPTDDSVEVAAPAGARDTRASGKGGGGNAHNHARATICYSTRRSARTSLLLHAGLELLGA